MVMPTRRKSHSIFKQWQTQTKLTVTVPVPATRVGDWSIIENSCSSGGSCSGSGSGYSASNCADNANYDEDENHEQENSLQRKRSTSGNAHLAHDSDDERDVRSDANNDFIFTPNAPKRRCSLKTQQCQGALWKQYESAQQQHSVTRSPQKLARKALGIRNSENEENLSGDNQNATSKARIDTLSTDCLQADVSHSVASIDWPNSSAYTYVSDVESRSYSPIATAVSGTTQPQCTAPSELDLLLALIERQSRPLTPTQATANGGSVARRSRCRRDGYVQHLRHTLKAAVTDRRFLQQDREQRLEAHTEFVVLQLESVYGMQAAIVQPTQTHVDEADAVMLQGNSGRMRLVLEPEIAQAVRVGDRLEAYFEPDCAPIVSVGEDGATEMITHVQPYRLLLLERSDSVVAEQQLELSPVL